MSAAAGRMSPARAGPKNRGGGAWGGAARGGGRLDRGGEGFRQLEDRPRLPLPDVEHLACDGRLRGLQHRLNDILDENEVPRLSAVAVDRRRPSVEQAFDEQRDDGGGGGTDVLARPGDTEEEQAG